jgi:hypothetical protein
MTALAKVTSSRSRMTRLASHTSLTGLNAENCHAGVVLAVPKSRMEHHEYRQI